MLICGWVIYLFLHSLLASNQIKELVRVRLGFLSKYYRLGYVVISTAGLLFLLFYNANIPAADFFTRTGMVRYISLVLAAFGAIILKVAFRTYDLSAFIGIRKETNSFVKDGLLRHVRHPIYSGTLLIVLGFFFFSPNLPTLISALCIFLYLPIGIWLEEQKLIKEFGDEYRTYKSEVPAIIPRLF